MALREQKKVQTRDALFNAAVALFVERGYDGTTMDDIAERALVSRATAFTYFPKKEDLLLEWAVRRRQAVSAQSGQAPEERGHPDQIKKVVMALADAYGRDKAGRAFVVAWLSTGSPLRSEAWVSADVLSELVRAGQAAHVLRRDVDRQVAGRLLLNAFLGVLYQWASQSRSAAWLRREVDAELSVILDGLTASVSHLG